MISSALPTSSAAQPRNPSNVLFRVVGGVWDQDYLDTAYIAREWSGDKTWTITDVGQNAKPVIAKLVTVSLQYNEQ